MFLKQEVERLKNIEETTRRDYRNISENGAEIRLFFVFISRLMSNESNVSPWC